MLPGVSAAVAAFRPDALLVDQQALAGAVVAQRRDLPWATSATTSAELVDPFTLMPRLGAWAAERVASLGGAGDLRFSEHLVIAFSTPALVGEREWPAHYAFVGPSMGLRPSGVSFPWESLADQPRVLVSLGTVNSGARFFAAAAEAFGSLDAQGIFVCSEPPVVPSNVLVRDRVPQLDLLRHLDVVVTHGGHNTVCESLACGLPLVVAPIRDDQPVVAEQVTAAGAGVRVKFGRVTGPELAAAIRTVLDDPTYRAAAARISSEFASAGGAPAAADRLEKLL
jgi:MGT family glycosyltransferase